MRNDNKIVSLEHLNIVRNNFIDSTFSCSLKGLPKLQGLILSGSNMKFLPNDIFEPIVSTIQTISLASNQLKVLPSLIFAAVLKWDRRVQINLDGSPWHCDYLLSSLREQMIHYYLSFHETTCVTLEELKGKTLFVLV